MNVEKLCMKYYSYRMYYVCSVYMHTAQQIQYTMRHTHTRHVCVRVCIITSAKEVVKLHIMYRAVCVRVRVIKLRRLYHTSKWIGCLLACKEFTIHPSLKSEDSGKSHIMYLSKWSIRNRKYLRAKNFDYKRRWKRARAQAQAQAHILKALYSEKS